VNRFNDNWPSTARFNARLAAIERVVGRSRLNVARRNTGLLNLIDFDIALDVWDGLLHPDDVEERYRRDFECMKSRGDVHDDGSIGGRLDRLTAAAAETYRPPRA
jgi:hypothetical protein